VAVAITDQPISVEFNAGEPLAVLSVRDKTTAEKEMAHFGRARRSSALSGGTIECLII